MKISKDTSSEAIFIGLVGIAIELAMDIVR